LTARGVSAYHPRVTTGTEITTAVVLAAGSGSRLLPHTEFCPKCLVPVGGRTLLGRTMDNLAAAGITELVIVAGYCEESLRAFAAGRAGGPRVTFVRNEVFASTNNAYSLWLARVAVPGAFVLVDGDVLYDPRVLTTLLATPGDAALAVERRGDLAAEEMKVLAGPDGHVAAVNKTMDPATATGESIGLARFTADTAAALWTRLGEQIAGGQRNVFYELAFEQLIAAGRTFAIADVTGFPCMEIDTPEDLAAAHVMAARTGL